MEIKYIDNHCHLNFKDFEVDREEVLKRMEKEKVGGILVGTRKETSKEVVSLAKTKENLWSIVGLHPIYTTKETFDKGFFSKIILEDKVVGVGECGFDFFHNLPQTKEIQEKAFRFQIELAIKFKKPLMLHIRSGNGVDAYKETFRVLKDYSNLKGEAHFFAGSLEDLKEFLDLGFYISFTGVITFTKDYDELVKIIPPDRLLSETDSPYVAPVPNRGKRCEPLFVRDIIRKMAEIRDEGFEEFSQKILKNSLDLWNL